MYILHSEGKVKIMIRRKDQIINSLHIAKKLNSKDNDTTARYGFDSELIDNILLYCRTDEIIKTLNLAKEQLRKEQEESPDKDGYATRICLRNHLIDKLLLELGNK